MSLALQARDLELLRFLAAFRAAPVDVIAQRFFASDPRTGKQNTNPERAAERRLDALRKAGLVHRGVLPPSTMKERGGPVFVLTSEGATAVGQRRKQVHARHQHHHLETMRMVEAFRRDVEHRGGEVLRVVLEDERRAELLGKKTKRGIGRRMRAGERVRLDEYGVVPDAVVVVKMASEAREKTFALEYITGHYKDAAITAKAKTFAGQHDGLVLSADSVTTKNRVERLTKLSCAQIR